MTLIFLLMVFCFVCLSEQNRPFYQILSDLMQDSHGLILSLLMGNNLVNYFATSLVTYLFLTRSDNAGLAEVYATAIMTPILFLLGEILPKNLFYYKADAFMVFLSPLIWFFHKLFTLSGVVPALKWLSNRLNQLFHSSIDTSQAVDLTQREQIKQIFHETQEEGLVSDFQRTMMDRLVRIPDLPVTSVMIPLDQVHRTDLNTSREQLLARIADCPFTRLPVYEQTRSNITGYIDVYKTLGSNRPFDRLTEFLEPLVTLPVPCSVISALHQMRRQSCPIALVVSGATDKKECLGIVTIKDLMEEFVGELH
jgi:putative hemolysin